METKLVFKKAKVYTFKLRKHESGGTIIADTNFYFHESDALDVGAILSALTEDHMVTVTVELETDGD